MAPTVNSGNYAKDLSKAPSLSGGVYRYMIHEFIIPDDTIIYRIVEKSYEKAEYGYIAEVYELAFHSQLDFVEKHIEKLRDDGESDEEVVRQIIQLKMEDDDKAILVARFAYDSIDILDQNQRPASGIQIRGAYVDPERSGAGLAGQIYRQFILIYGYLVCDNVQTEFGAALWAGTIRDVVGRVDIYDCAAGVYLQELGDKGIGVNGLVPWNLNAAVQPHRFQLNRWVNYPFEIKSCHHIVLIVSQ